MARFPSARPADRFRASGSKRLFPSLFIAAFAACVLFSLREAQVDPRVLLEGDTLGNVAKLVRGMFPPRLDVEFLRLMVGPELLAELYAGHRDEEQELEQLRDGKNPFGAACRPLPGFRK